MIPFDSHNDAVVRPFTVVISRSCNKCCVGETKPAEEGVEVSLQLLLLHACLTRLCR